MLEEHVLPELKTIRCKVKLIHPTHNNYTIAIVEKENRDLIPISIPYNYEFNIKIDDFGVLTYEEAIAGKTEWYKKDEDRYYKHNYTVYYLKYFVPELHVDGQLQQELHYE